MNNYVITNAFLNTNAFGNLKKSIQKAFSDFGEDAVFMTNAEGYKLTGIDGKGSPVLFFDKDVLLCRMLEKRGYRSINSSVVIENCDDKAKTFIELNGKIAMPLTLIAPFTYENIGYSDYSFLNDAEEKLGYPIIVKEGKGSFGKQVFLVNNRVELEKTVKSLTGRSIVFQKYVKESCGRDVRIYVVGGKAVAGGERINENDFRSNVQSGGKMMKIDLNNCLYADYRILAEKTAAVIGADFCGVDLLMSESGPLVCEVNSNAHFAALSEATGVNVAAEIVGYFLSCR